MTSHKKITDEDKGQNIESAHADTFTSIYQEIEKELQKDTISKETLYQWFKEEIQRKDDEIAKLRHANDVLFKTALKANERTIEDKEFTSNEKAE